MGLEYLEKYALHESRARASRRSSLGLLRRVQKGTLAYMIRSKHSIITGLIALLTCSCGLENSTKVARQAVDEFHRRVEASERDAIYDQATDHYRSLTGREANREIFARLRRKMGKCTASQNTGLLVTSNTQGTYVTTTYRTDCEKGPLEETIIWSVENQRVKLWQYNATSPLLLVD
jgi:hypothetical protein